jgi:hypothetical protein
MLMMMKKPEGRRQRPEAAIYRLYELAEPIGAPLTHEEWTS